MVQNPRAKARADQLRPLNHPRLVEIRTKDGWPVVLVEGGRSYRIAQIQDIWRIDDEWWRNPISRCYYRLVLANDSLRTVYHDLIADTWYAQTY